MASALLASTSVLENPPSISYLGNDVLTVFDTVAVRNISAYADELGSKDLVMGSTANVSLEAAEGINMYLADGSNAGINLFTTMYDQLTKVRTDTKVFSVRDVPLSTTTLISAEGANMLSLQSADAANTVYVGDLTLYTQSNQQHIATSDARGFVFDDVVQAPDLVAARHLFGQDVNMVVRTGRSNLGDLAEVGYTFHMNAELNLELVKYGKVVTASGFSNIYKRVGVFGNMALASSTGDVHNFTPFADLDA